MAKEDIKKSIKGKFNEESLDEDEIAMINRILKLDLKPLKRDKTEDFDVLEYIGFIDEDLKEE